MSTRSFSMRGIAANSSASLVEESLPAYLDNESSLSSMRRKSRKSFRSFHKRVTNFSKTLKARLGKRKPVPRGEAQKLLVVGDVGSGKETLRRQLLHIFNHEYEQEFRRIVPWRSLMRTQIKMGAAKLASCWRDYGEPLRDARLERAVRYLLRWLDDPSRERVIEEELSNSDIKAILMVYESKTLQSVFEQAAGVLDATTLDLLDRVHEIASDDFVPSVQDILRVKLAHRGTVEAEFEWQSLPFVATVVAGTAKHQAQWPLDFPGSHGLVFCLNLSAYDSPDLLNAIDLFARTANLERFKARPVHVILTHFDVFRAQMASTPAGRADLARDLANATPNERIPSAIFDLVAEFAADHRASHEPVEAAHPEFATFVPSSDSQRATYLDRAVSYFEHCVAERVTVGSRERVSFHRASLHCEASVVEVMDAILDRQSRAASFSKEEVAFDAHERRLLASLSAPATLRGRPVSRSPSSSSRGGKRARPLARPGAL